MTGLNKWRVEDEVKRGRVVTLVRAGVSSDHASTEVRDPPVKIHPRVTKVGFPLSYGPRFLLKGQYGPYTSYIVPLHSILDQRF